MSRWRFDLDGQACRYFEDLGEWARAFWAWMPRASIRQIDNAMTLYDGYFCEMPYAHVYKICERRAEIAARQLEKGNTDGLCRLD